MALDQVPEQYGVKVFLVDLYSQVPVEADDFRKATGFPVLFKRLLHEKPFFRGHGAHCVDLPVIQEFSERKRKELPGQSPASHLGGDFL